MKPAASALVSTVVVVLSACAEGYQGDGPPLRLHYDMTLAETLAAMDRVRQAVPESGSHHRLQAQCALQWREDRQERTVSLLDVESALEKLPADDHYHVVLEPRTKAEAVSSVVVMRDAPWAEAAQMKWLLDYARRFC